MGKIRFLWNNLADAAGTTPSASSAAAEWPLANLRTIWPKWYHRTASLGTPDFWAWNLGAAASISYVILWNHNFTPAATVRIQADVHAAHWADVDAPLIYGTHWNDDILIYHFSTPRTDCQYWRIIATDAANPDGYLRAGRAFLGGHFQPQYSFDRRSPGIIDPSDISFSTGGQMSANKREPFGISSFEFSGVKEADRATLKTIFLAVGRNTPYFLIEDHRLHLTRTLYGRNSSDLLFSPVTGGYFSMALEFEEAR